MRIFLLCSFLIGSTVFFAYQSLNQFNNALDNLSASYTAVQPLPNTTEITSLISSSTPVETDSSVFSTSSTTPDISVAQDNTDPNFQLIFKPNKEGVYIGCTYQISWLASTTIKSLETTLVDAGTRKPTGPVASGLAKENNIEANSQGLKWKVGVVWPGEYFISISNVNGVAINEKSRVFTINEMPRGLEDEEQKNLCEETGGNLF